MKKVNLILGIVIALILFGFGCSFSYFVGKKETCPFEGLLSSKAVRGNFSALLSGEIQEISGNSLTLDNSGEILIISVKGDASIYRLISPEKTTKTPQSASREDIKIGEIKIGDRANITCQLKADGTLEGTEVVVLP